MTAHETEVIVDMYKKGCSYSKIAKALHLSEHVVKHWVRRNRVEYDLPRRRNLAQKSGVISDSVMLDSKWNIERGVELIKRKWPCTSAGNC
jgi:transposase